MKPDGYMAVAALAALAFTAPAVHAAPMEAEGAAPLDKGIAYARQAAKDDARRQLALQRGAVVVSGEQMTSSGELLQSAAVRPAGQVGPASTVREWKSGDALHVLMQAGDDAGSGFGLDEDEGGNASATASYRKKVLITPFRVTRPEHVADMDDVPLGMSRNLYERLGRSGKLQPRLGKYVVPNERMGATPEQTAAAVRQLARDNDSQFVLAGEVVDAGTSTVKGFLSSTTTRNFEVRTSLYDGLTGVLIAERRIGRQGEGEVGIGRHRPFGSASFFSTAFGCVVDAVLGSAAAEMMQDLAPLPFTARIVRIENRKLIFDAGVTSAVQPGDKLIAYSRKPEWDVGAALHGAGGVPESPVATVSVVQVHPAFSVGEMSEQPARVHLKVGDYVRFASSSQ
ncbi:flagella assembly protein FlgT middle domain-containing protein [Noviherbaspirillum aerium]|uniref:flagella assembly protein FlgT middle domain-containing protein n=1 Tax=Noviherbaspirillum aerium TaxID=2588497 RepID=UPI00178C6275|nr:flagella assembly protein FlgT middle domain-containing protein [Noviherbaspirillum aerium]